MSLRIEYNALDAKTFTYLRQDENFRNYAPQDIEIALSNTLFSVLLIENEQPVGMGRVVGDNRISFFIKDVAVDEKHQHNGYGKMIMNHLLSYIEAKGCDKAYIGLMSTPNKEPFYEQFGFIKRPNEKLGSGMVKFL